MSGTPLMGALAFNLLTNAIGSFLLAAALSSLASTLLRAEARHKQLFLAIPLVKLVWDIARGIPANSFFWLKMGGVRQDLGTFQFGVGLGVCPVVSLRLGALKGGTSYPQSMAELFSTAVTRSVGTKGPALVVVVLFGIGAMLLLGRATSAAKRLQAAAAHRRAARIVERRIVGSRTVDVVVSSDYEGVPFVTGFLRPFVCFSQGVYESLSLAEREAVVHHEVGHLAHRDLALFAGLALFADVFWFVPALRSRCRAIQAEAEVCADEWALRAGGSPEALATALVRVAEVTRLGPVPAMGMGFTRGSRVLVRRVHRLLGRCSGERARRTAFVSAWRAAVTVWIIFGILQSTGLGNH